MGKQIKILTIIAFAFGLGFGIANVAMSETPVFNAIAVADLDQVVSSSNGIKSIRKEQQKKNADLRAWLVKVQSDIDKQKTSEAKKAKKEKYDKEFTKKKADNDKAIARSLNEVDRNIYNAIAKYAKSNDYSIVLSKNVVVYGGKDITGDLIKELK